MPSKNDLFFFEKCQAKLDSVRLKEMKFRARTLSLAHGIRKSRLLLCRLSPMFKC